MPADGVLYLGGAETVLGITERFKPMDNQRGLYVVNPPGGAADRQGRGGLTSCAPSAHAVERPHPQRKAGGRKLLPPAFFVMTETVPQARRQPAACTFCGGIASSWGSRST